MFAMFARKDKTTEDCFVLGDDQRFMRKALETSGAFLVDTANKFAYDITPQNIAIHIQYDRRGKVSSQGKCALLAEISAQPWHWKNQAWNEIVADEAQLMRDGRMEAVGSISADQESDEKWERFMPVLYGALGILALVAVIACVSSGVFDRLGDVF